MPIATLRLIVLLPVLLALSVSARGVVPVDTLSVTNTNASGSGSLQLALSTANAIINASPSTPVYIDARTVHGTITATSSFDIANHLIIEGPVERDLFLSNTNGNTVISSGVGPNTYRVQLINLGVSGNNCTSANCSGAAIENSDQMVLVNCTISDNRNDNTQNVVAKAGAISNFSGASLHLENCEITRNDNTTNEGSGAVYNQGLLTVNNTIIRENLSRQGGSALLNTGRAKITASTVYDNQILLTNSDAGTISSTTTGAELTLINVTVFRNIGRGVVIGNQAEATVSFSSIASNDRGEGVFCNGLLNINNSIVTANIDASFQDNDLVLGSSGRVESTLGHNIFGVTDESAIGGITQGTQYRVRAADIFQLVGPVVQIDENGGATPTLALKEGSLAERAGAADTVIYDQRGYLRNPVPDVGAYERGGTLLQLQPLTATNFCAGEAIDFSFEFDGYDEGSTFSIQRSTDPDNFTNPETLATGTSAPLSVTLPAVANTTTFYFRVQTRRQASEKQEIIVFPSPRATFEGTPEQCLGDTVQLSATDSLLAETYRWVMQSSGDTLSRKRSLVYPGTATRNDSLQLVVANAVCEASQTLPLEIQAPPSTNISGDTVICANEPLLVQAVEEEADSFQWKAADTIRSAEQSLGLPPPLNFSSVRLQVTRGACTVQRTYAIQNKPVPDAGIIGQTSVCPGDTIRLQAADTTALLYTWLNNGEVIANNTRVLESESLQTGDEVSLQLQQNGCLAESEPLVVNYQQLPDAAPPISGPDSACNSGASVTFSTAAVPSALSYRWEFSGALASVTGTELEAGRSVSLLLPDSASINTIQVAGENECGTGQFSPVKTLQVFSPPEPVGIINGPQHVCRGSSRVPFAVERTTGADFYQWSFPEGVRLEGSNAQQITNSIRASFGEEAQSGQVTVQAVNGCGAGEPAEPINLTVVPVPEAFFEVKEQQNARVPFAPEDLSSGAIERWQWDFGDLTRDTLQQPTHIYLETGTYPITLQVTDIAGCSDEYVTEVTVEDLENIIQIKNVITPNGDGQNDVLYIENIERYPGSRVKLIDRSGKMVYSAGAYQNNWDARVNGKVLPAGTYICLVQLTEVGVTRRQTVSILR